MELDFFLKTKTNGQHTMKTFYSQPSPSFRGFWSKKTPFSGRRIVKLYTLRLKTLDPEDSVTYPSD